MDALIRPYAALLAGAFNTQPAASTRFTQDDEEDPVERFSLKPRPGNSPIATRKASIVIAEDNPGDVRLVRLALEEHGVEGELTVLADGETAIRYLEKVNAGKIPCPNLMILDLNLPKKTGHEVLHHLRQFTGCRELPVVILSSSDAAREFAHASPAGVRHYLRKPQNLDAFLKLGAVFRATLSSMG